MICPNCGEECNLINEHEKCDDGKSLEIKLIWKHGFQCKNCGISTLEVEEYSQLRNGLYGNNNVII